MATWSLFGYSIVRKVDDTKESDSQVSFVPKNTDDGSAIIAASGSMGGYVDLDGTMRTEAELIDKYRAMAEAPEVVQALQEIVNEAICVDESDVVKLDLDDLDTMATDPVKDAIQEAFDEILHLLEFNEKGYYIFERNYVDGRLNYHVVIDKEKVKDGIKELRYIDPRKIRKIREVENKQVAGENGQMVPVKVTKAEYYMYSEGGFTLSPGQIQRNQFSPSVQGLKIAPDAIVNINSGIHDPSGTLIYSHLHKAIKPLNVLRAIEDAIVIYRLVRAAERRVWYIDVGNMPKASAEQYVRDIMNKQKNQLNYDVSTGQVRDSRKFTTMLEDYYLPRREGSQGTKVETLPAAQGLNQLDDVEYFQKKLYNALSVPISRLQPDDAFSIGRATEITRDEVAFGKFIIRLRTRFNGLFTQLLEKQLVLKGVMSIEDFKKLAPNIKYTYANDNYFMEMKEADVNTTRLDLLEKFAPWIGRYVSNKWILTNVLRLTEEESEQMRTEIEEEENDPIFSKPIPGQEPPMDPSMMGMGPEEMPPDDGMGGPPMDGDPNQQPDTYGASGPPNPRHRWAPRSPRSSPRVSKRRSLGLGK